MGAPRREGGSGAAGARATRGRQPRDEGGRKVAWWGGGPLRAGAPGQRLRPRWAFVGLGWVRSGSARARARRVPRSRACRSSSRSHRPRGPLEIVSVAAGSGWSLFEARGPYLPGRSPSWLCVRLDLAPVWMETGCCGVFGPGPSAALDRPPAWRSRGATVTAGPASGTGDEQQVEHARRAARNPGGTPGVLDEDRGPCAAPGVRAASAPRRRGGTLAAPRLGGPGSSASAPAGRWRWRWRCWRARRGR